MLTKRLRGCEVFKLTTHRMVSLPKLRVQATRSPGAELPKLMPSPLVGRIEGRPPCLSGAYLRRASMRAATRMYTGCARLKAWNPEVPNGPKPGRDDSAPSLPDANPAFPPRR